MIPVAAGMTSVVADRISVVAISNRQPGSEASVRSERDAERGIVHGSFISMGIAGGGARSCAAAQMACATRHYRSGERPHIATAVHDDRRLSTKD
jgi:hypothetical protein